MRCGWRGSPSENCRTSQQRRRQKGRGDPGRGERREEERRRGGEEERRRGGEERSRVREERKKRVRQGAGGVRGMDRRIRWRGARRRGEGKGRGAYFLMAHSAQTSGKVLVCRIEILFCSERKSHSLRFLLLPDSQRHVAIGQHIHLLYVRESGWEVEEGKGGRGGGGEGKE
eukprot:397768-Hanusia_phi.AAC.1